MSGKGDASRPQLEPPNEIVHRLTDEGVAVKSLAQQRVAIQAQAAAGGHAVNVARVIETLERSADREHPVGIGVSGRGHARAGRRKVGVASHVMVGQRIVPQQCPVVAAEPVAPVVAHAAVLRQPGQRLKGAGVGVQPEIPPANVHQFAPGEAGDAAADQSVRAMHPAVEAVGEAIHPRLIVGGGETRKQRAPDVRAPVAVGVLGVKDVRRGADQDAFPPSSDAGRERQAVEEHRPLVGEPIAVDVLQKNDPAARLVAAAEAQRIIVHLDDPRFAVRAEVDRDRVDDQRLGGDQLDPQAGADANRAQRRLGRFWLCAFGALFLPKCPGQLPMNLADDFVLQANGQFRRAIVIDHRSCALIATLFEYALGRDVARRVVGVGVDPNPVAVELPLEPQRVVNHHFARQKHHRQLVAKAPGLDGVIEPGLQRLATSQTRELHPGVIADRVGALGQALPLGLGRRRAEREIHLAKRGFQLGGDRRQ